MKVKVCGITNLIDAKIAVQYGADALGFIFYEKSKRVIDIEKAAEIISKLPKNVLSVGVFVDQDTDYINTVKDRTGITTVQLHGSESPKFLNQINGDLIKAFRVDDSFDFKNLDNYYNCSYLLDSKSDKEYGGTGKKFDWNLIPKNYHHKIILAGGVSVNNIDEILVKINPYMIDLSSSLEYAPGRKDHKKIKDFFNKLRRIEEC